MPENKEKEEEKPVVAKTAIDLQRLKLQKLMKNPVNIRILKYYSYKSYFFFLISNKLRNVIQIIFIFLYIFNDFNK